MTTVWKGKLRISQIGIQIGLQSAINSKTGISSHLIHAECGSRIKQVKRCELCDRTLEPHEVVRGYEVEDGAHVILTPEELASTLPANNKELIIDRFTSKLDPMYLDKPYFIEPENHRSITGITVIRKALKNRVGLGHMVLRSKTCRVALTARGKGLILFTLQAAEAVRAQPLQAEVPVESEYVKMADRLIKQMTAEPSWEHFEDQHLQSLENLIANKTEGKEYIRPVQQALESVEDMKEALQRSLADEEVA